MGGVETIPRRRPGRPADVKLAEYRRRYGLTKRQVYALGGVERLERMSGEARQVLLNLLNSQRRTRP